MRKHKRPLFITFEGGEGAGKTTLINKIESEFTSRGLPFVRTREPGGTKLGERIRHWLLNKDPDINISGKAELLLFLASRAQHVDEFIKPSLDEGKFVLCDRFNDSSVAYQGWARGLGIETVQKMCDLACGSLIPDVTFYLDLDPQIGLSRTKKLHKENAAAGEMDRIEAEAEAFHQKVREGFLKLAEIHPARIRVLDATLSPEDVFADAWKEIEKRIGK